MVQATDWMKFVHLSPSMPNSDLALCILNPFSISIFWELCIPELFFFLSLSSLDVLKF